MTKRSVIITTSIVVGLIAIFTILFGVVFRVRNIKISYSKDFKYKEQIGEILSASKLKKGTGIFSVDADKVADNIEQEFPYARVEGVNITSCVSVKITLSMREPLYYVVEHTDTSEKYYILDEDCKVLYITTDSAEATGYILLDNAFSIGQDVEEGDFLTSTSSTSCTALYYAMYSNAMLNLDNGEGVKEETYLDREDMCEVIESVKFGKQLDDLVYGKIDNITLITTYGVKIEISDTAHNLDLKVNMAFSALRTLLAEDETNDTNFSTTGTIVVRYAYDENNTQKPVCEYRVN